MTLKDAYESAKEEVSEHPIAYSGGAAGVISEAQGFVTDIDLYGDYLNPLQLDWTMMHSSFNVFLAYGSDRVLEYAADNPDLAQKVMFSGAVLAGFTVAKEYGIDQTADYLDMVGNTFGWGFYRGSDYGWGNLWDDGKALGQEMYDRVR